MNRVLIFGGEFPSLPSACHVASVVATCGQMSAPFPADRLTPQLPTWTSPVPSSTPPSRSMRRGNRCQNHILVEHIQFAVASISSPDSPRAWRRAATITGHRDVGISVHSRDSADGLIAVSVVPIRDGVRVGDHYSRRWPDAQGRPLDRTPFTYSSAMPIATVNTFGVVTGVAAGTTSITARTGTFTAAPA
jgi:hypothetical protein